MHWGLEDDGLDLIHRVNLNKAIPGPISNIEPPNIHLSHSYPYGFVRRTSPEEGSEPQFDKWDRLL